MTKLVSKQSKDDYMQTSTGKVANFQLPEVEVTAKSPTGDDWKDRNLYQAYKGRRYISEGRQKAEPLAFGLAGLTVLPGIAALAPAVSATLNNPYVNAAFTVDGVRNALSGEGVQKTYRLAKEGDYWGATKSGVVDALDLYGGANLFKGVAKAGNKWAKTKLLSKTLDNSPKNIDKAVQAFRNSEWSNFLATRNGDNYYRMAKSSKLPNTNIEGEKLFISHTTPWEEFSGLGTSEPIGTKVLYEFPTKTFGVRKATNYRGIPGEIDVTQMGRNHLNFGNTSSGFRGKVQLLPEQQAEIIGMDPYTIGINSRPLNKQGFYNTRPDYEDIYLGNQTIVTSKELKDALLNSEYNQFEYSPSGIIKKLYTPSKYTKYADIGGKPKQSVNSYDFFDESNPQNLSPVSIKNFFKNDVEKRTHILDNPAFIPNSDNWYKYELHDFQNGLLGDYTPSLDRVRIARTLDPVTSHTTKVHEFRHKLESQYPLNYQQRKHLDEAYRIFSTKEPRIANSRNLAEKTATNTELRAKLYHKFRQTNGRNPRDIREMDNFIDNLSKSEIRDALRSINGYGQDYVESILSKIESAKQEGLPKEAIQDGVNKWVENVKQALKYVPTTVGVSLIPKNNNTQLGN